MLQQQRKTERTYDRHPSFHGKPFNSRSTVFDDRTSPTSCPNLADDMKDDVLTTYARGKLSIDLDSHIFASLRDKRLCREHMLDF